MTLGQTMCAALLQLDATLLGFAMAVCAAHPLALSQRSSLLLIKIGAPLVLPGSENTCLTSLPVTCFAQVAPLRLCLPVHISNIKLFEASDALKPTAQHTCVSDMRNWLRAALRT